MKKQNFKRFFMLFCILSMGGFAIQSLAQQKDTTPIIKVQIKNGSIAGLRDADQIVSFKGIPYAQPPIGELRWKAPLPAKNWKGIKKAFYFGARAMQNPLFSDMVFRSKSMSEDCLYLNVWTPRHATGKKLPVLVYFYGGGYVSGDASEPRYDGESMAKKGIVVVTVNYRVGIFGFLSTEALNKQTPYGGSGNFGLLDQLCALKWVRDNIAAFGGDYKKVTIGGESAGSISVSAQMASPLSHGLFRGAIGESGSIMGAMTPFTLKEADQNAQRFMKENNIKDFSEMRNLPADTLLAMESRTQDVHFQPTIDGYFFIESPFQTFKEGKQNKVPLLVGWNSAELPGFYLFGKQTPNAENFRKIQESRFKGEDLDSIRKYYPSDNNEILMRSATNYMSDFFIVFSTWKWAYEEARTGGQPVYRYFFDQSRPENKTTGKIENPFGASHSGEIEYALGNLPLNHVYNWNEKDYQASATMQSYFANFILFGNPNGNGLPEWKAYEPSTPMVQKIGEKSNSFEATDENRYQYISRFYK